MEKIDRFMSFLSYNRRFVKQLLDIKNLKYFHLIFKGFTPDKGYYFDFKRYGYNNYVKDTTRYLETVFINYNNRDLMDDKYGCSIFLEKFTDKVVPVYGLVDHGKFYFLNKKDKIETMFTNGKKFIIKPRKGRAGEGVKLLKIQNNKYYLEGQEFLKCEDVFKGLKNYILNPYIEQHEYAARIHNKSLNTLRLITCVLDD